MGYYVLVDIVDLSSVKKQLRKVPRDIIRRLQRWVLYVEMIGLIESRKIPGLHDEPLKGKWKRYRSIRLGKTWRAIYIKKKDGSINIAEVKEVTPHEY